MTYSKAIEKAYNMLKTSSDTPKLDAKVILKNCTNSTDVDLILNAEKELTSVQQSIFFADIDKRINHKPVAYITNSKEFYGRIFYVDENVLIPRPDTETLIEGVLSFLIGRNTNDLKILDLCTGTGCIGITLSLETNAKYTLMTDISPKAIAIAKKNFEFNNGKNGEFRLGNLFEPVGNEKFDIIVSNPPYISTDQMKVLSDDVLQEPNLALEAGIDGFDVILPLVKNAKEHLNIGGALFIECDYRQTEELELIFKQNTFKETGILKDLSGLERVVWGVKNE